MICDGTFTESWECPFVLIVWEHVRRKRDGSWVCGEWSEGVKSAPDGTFRLCLWGVTPQGCELDGDFNWMIIKFGGVGGNGESLTCRSKLGRVVVRVLTLVGPFVLSINVMFLCFSVSLSGPQFARFELFSFIDLLAGYSVSPSTIYRLRFENRGKYG